MYATLTIEAIDFEQELIFTPEERYAQLTLYVQQLQLSVESNLSTVVAEFFLGNYLKGVGISSIVKTSSVGLVDTYTITFTDNTTTTFEVTNGEVGADGIGISNIELVSTVGNVKTYRITFTDGSTFEYTITDGADGRGIVSIIKTSTVGLVDTYTITFTDATTSTFDVTNGTNGEMNVIEEVQVNSVPLEITDKSVNVIVPTQPSDIGAEPANANIQEHISDETIHHTIEELNEVYEPANSNIQEHISDTDIHIDSSSELGEAINESTHSLLLWNGLKALKVTFARLKTWIGSYFFAIGGNTFGSKKLIGSTDNQDFGIITNNLERVTVTKDGKVGFGVPTPSDKIDVLGKIRATTDNNSYANFYAVSNGGLYPRAFYGIKGNTGYSNVGFTIANDSGDSLERRAYFSASTLTNAASPSAHSIVIQITPTYGEIYSGQELGGQNLPMYLYSGSLNRLNGITIYPVNSSGNSSMNVGIATIAPKSKLQVAGGIQCGDDTAAASSDKVGTFRYRATANASYVEMCVQTGATSYQWQTIITNTW